MNLWISLAFTLLTRLSGPFRSILSKTFDGLARLAGKTDNPVDDFFVGLTRLVVLGQYKPAGKGGMETVLKILAEKVTPDVRASMKAALDAAYTESLTTESPYDEQAIDFVRKALFPEEFDLEAEEGA